MQNLRLAASVLRELAASKQPALITRVATSWLKKALSQEYDILARLQVLEGADGLRSGAWSARGRQGLRLAEQSLSGSVEPSWLSPKETGFYKMLRQQAASILSQSGGALDADDLLQNALGGIGRDRETGELIEVKKLLYEVGKHLADKVTSGQETPASVANGLAGAHLRNKAISQVMIMRRKKHDTPTVDDEGGGDPIQNLRDPTRALPVEDLLVQVFDDQQSVLSRLIRGKMRSLVNGLQGDRQDRMRAGLTQWLDTFEETGAFPSQVTFAQEMGIAASTLMQRWFKPFFAKLESEIYSDPSILDEVRKYQYAQAIHMASRKKNSSR